jgi:hypothetical protein
MFNDSQLPPPRSPFQADPPPPSISRFAGQIGCAVLGYIPIILVSVMFIGVVCGGPPVKGPEDLQAFLGAIVVGSLIGGSIVLAGFIWVALGPGGVRRQFTIASGLIFTAMFALYLGVTKGLWARLYSPDRPMIYSLIATAVVLLVLAAFSFIPVLLVADPLAWFAVWIVRRPAVQAYLRRRRQQRICGEEGNERPASNMNRG